MPTNGKEITLSMYHPQDTSGKPYNTKVWCDQSPHNATRCPFKIIGKCTHVNCPPLPDIMIDGQKSGLDNMRDCAM